MEGDQVTGDPMKSGMISDSGHEVDALGHAGEEGRISPERVR